MSNEQKRAVHVAIITKHYKGKTYVTHLLRHTFREGGKVKHLTLGNLSDLPDDLIDAMRKRLAGEPLPARATTSRSYARCRTGIWRKCWEPCVGVDSTA